jgi:hypothetical protein
MSLSCEVCVLSGRFPCNGLIPRPEQSYRMCMYVCIIESDQAQQYLPTPTMSRVEISRKEIKYTRSWEPNSLGSKQCLGGIKQIIKLNLTSVLKTV